MAEFNAMEWLQLADQRRKQGVADAEETAGQFFASREAAQNGAGFLGTMQAGLKNRRAVMDPMYELKKAKLQTEILGTASQFQQQILSNQIRQKQIDDEAADNLAQANIVKQFGGNPQEMLKAYNSTFWKSARGIANATQARLQLSELMDMDETSKLWSQMPWDVKAQLTGLERGSPEWMAKVRELAETQGKKDFAPGSLENDLNWLNQVRKGGDTKAIAEAERMFKNKYPDPVERNQILLGRYQLLAPEKRRARLVEDLDAARQKIAQAKTIPGGDDIVKQYEALIGQINSELESLRTEAAAAPASAKPGENKQKEGSPKVLPGVPVTDKKGKKWYYLGTMKTPEQDRNPQNWKPAE